MSFWTEFKQFAVKGNVIDLAVAVVIGGAFSKIVTAFVSDIIMPIVSGIMPQGDWRQFEVTSLHIKIGDFAGTIVDFLIVALFIFIAVVKVMGAAKKPPPPGEPPATKACGECLEIIPAAARRCRACTAVVAALVMFFLATPARAQQAEPNLGVAPPAGAPPPAVEWKAQAKGGFLLTGGNSQTKNGTVSLTASRKSDGNKLSLDGMFAYGKSNVLFPVVSTTDPTVIAGVDRREVETTNTWLAKLRYDRFFTENNSGYVSAQTAGDRVAGKAFNGGGQVGYSRQLLKNDIHLLVAELGYDFSYERYVQQPGRTLDPIIIHSARILVGETAKITSETGATASIEALTNLNRETKAINVDTRTAGVAAFNDTRITGRLGLTTTIRKRLSVGLGLTVKYDQNPAPLPIPAGAPAGTMFGAMFPFAETTDYLGEATLVYTLL